MSIELSTAGIAFGYGVGASKPSSFTAIKGVKSLSAINPEPAVLDCTPLEETEYHRYIPGLKDLGGAWGVTVNDYDDFRASWNGLLDAYAAMESDDKMWFEIKVPGITEKGSFVFNGVPSELGFNGAEVDGVLENVAYIVINETSGWV